ncbi:hypothetical protein BJP35_2412 [Enterobacter sp. J49]|uniref:hypothetical protein n=1 Tax=Enterobacter sp. J49 TaxID=1903627 RepID=UPI000A3B92F1|nr:hypothetical protein [Enterobacter sp. J49]OUC37147.1 hypothetical protein BJP35_2412 [Enterobacter sp. J49]
MSRELNKDFIELVNHFSEYKIVGIFGNEKTKGKISMIHKRYYSLMSLVYCLFHFSRNKVDVKAMERLQETSSDLGTAMFLVINGAYKPANLMMRSCIENFIKSIGCLIDSSILEEKSLFKVIQRTGEHSIFEQNPHIYEILKKEYSSLCSHVHTATKKEMAHIKALNVFPEIDIASIDSLSKVIDKTVKSMIIIVIKMYRDAFFSFASEYREKILISLTPAQRAELHSYNE